MVVKASTKKRLMDLGLPRLYAHLWANDIRMGELVQMNLEETMKHLYRQNGKIQEWVRRSPEDLMSYNTFCRVGPAFFQADVNQFLLNSKTDLPDETFINYISNFIERAKVIQGERYNLKSFGGRNLGPSDLNFDRWGQKNPLRLLLNYSDLPFDNKT